jgi:hypothetical protein
VADATFLANPGFILEEQRDPLVRMRRGGLPQGRRQLLF